MSWHVNRPLGQILLLGAAFFAVAGCGDDTAERPARKVEAARKTTSSVEATPEGKKTNVGRNVFLEVLSDRRRVLISAEVCLRQGQLEMLLTRKGCKTHEAILAADIDARNVHTALELANAVSGSTVRLDPFRPPSGTRIKISLIYEKDGKKVTVPAQSWIRNFKTGKELESDWVFAGSMLVDNPLDPGAPKKYMANDGDVICVTNFEDAMLDVAIESSKVWAAHAYECWTERIPDEGTKVVVVLEPVVGKKK
jgi:hypothetical protein